MSAEHVTLAQLDKALAIEDRCRLLGADAEIVRGFTSDQRRRMEIVAGVRISSGTTWAIVARLLDAPRPDCYSCNLIASMS